MSARLREQMTACARTSSMHYAPSQFHNALGHVKQCRVRAMPGPLIAYTSCRRDEMEGIQER